MAIRTYTNSVAGRTGVVTLTKADVGLLDVDNTSDLNKPISTATQAALNAIVASGGVSTLNDLTDVAITTPSNGQIISYNGLGWVNSAPSADNVTSVAGKTGVVVLTKSDVGLGSVDNTADAAKNVLSATKLTTARTIGGVSFDGTANIDLPGVNAAGTQNTTGSAAKLTTPRTISLTGGVTGSASFDGSANISIAATVASGGTGDITVVDTLAELKALPVAKLAYLRNYVAGTQFPGLFRAVTGAAASTYTDKGTITVIPNGGNGSSAWIRDYDGAINVKWFNAIGNGIANDTTAINAALTYASLSKLGVFFPAGTYLYSGGGVLGDGVVAFGEGRNSTTIKSSAGTVPAGSLFYCQGIGSGVRHMKFDAAVTQTAGIYVYLGGIESFIEDFHMNKDFLGVKMTGNVSRIRNGRFLDASPGAVRIECGGGDNSQVIDDILMGAQGSNVATAGIKLLNCVALTITNTSVLQQGTGLLINPSSSADNVLNLYCDTCFFDNCTTGISITPTGTGVVARCKFNNVWVGSGTSNNIVISGSTIRGVDFNNTQSNLSSGSGFSLGGGCADITVRGGNISQNSYGIYLGSSFSGLRIQDVDMGASDYFNANTNYDVVFGASGFTNVIMMGNLFNTTNSVQNIANVTSGKIKNNINLADV